MQVEGQRCAHPEGQGLNVQQLSGSSSLVEVEDLVESVQYRACLKIVVLVLAVVVPCGQICKTIEFCPHRKT